MVGQWLRLSASSIGDTDAVSGHGSHVLLSAAKRKKNAEEFLWYDSILFTKNVRL